MSSHAEVIQAGGIVFKVESDEPRVLLVRDRTGSTWIFPKGHVQNDESLAEAALREVAEETGVRGSVVGSVEPPLRFGFEKKRFCVHHVLIAAAAGEDPSPEGREKRWLPPREALDLLSFDDARALLASVLPDIARHALAGRVRKDDDAFRELLIAEHHHLAESFLRNEEDGEKRVTFLITLAGGVAAVLGLVLGKDGYRAAEHQYLLAVSLALLSVLGYLTLIRVVHRNVAADVGKEAMGRIRKYFLASRDDSRVHFLPFDPHGDLVRPPTPPWSVGKGGWLVTVVFVEAALLGAFAAIVSGEPTWRGAVEVGAVVAVGAWIALLHLGQLRYRREMRKRNLAP